MENKPCSLYHLKPKNLQGDILYPLNTLKEKHPEAYDKAIAEYIGREDIPQKQIPLLNSTWGDVIHFSAVHPEEVKNALVEAGHTYYFDTEHFEIDPRIIDPKNAIVYIENEKGDSFTPYDPNELDKFSSLPQATKDHYKQMAEIGEKPFLYLGVPHILYKGTLDTGKLK
jgi:hypothetical protein